MKHKRVDIALDAHLNRGVWGSLVSADKAGAWYKVHSPKLGTMLGVEHLVGVWCAYSIWRQRTFAQ